MNIIVSKITKRKKIEFDDVRSIAVAAYHTMQAVEKLSTTVPAICITTAFNRLVLPFRSEKLCNDWLEYLSKSSVAADDGESIIITDVLCLHYSEFDALVQDIEVSDSAEQKANLEFVLNYNTNTPDTIGDRKLDNGWNSVFKKMIRAQGGGDLDGDE